MNLFVDYIQPLTNWLQQNPSWSLFITFLISLSESLAIVGSVIPGSVTMTAIGILAGTGIMRIDLTLLAAILGAIVGDGLSYALGYRYSDKLHEIWPFSKYPTWLGYGKEFFQRHGGISVLLGRFIGPLRSIIPVIAGVMHMKHWRFLIANVISAILWSLLYVMPGVLIGAASHELSAESSTRLLLLVLAVLVGIWLVSVFIKWLFTSLNNYFRTHLPQYWSGLKNHPVLFKLFYLVTPLNEKEHYLTASLVVLTGVSFCCFIGFAFLSMHYNWFGYYNQPAFLFLQSFRTTSLDTLFIICTQLTSFTTIGYLYVFFCFWFLYNKNKIAIRYLTSIIIFSTLFAYTLAYWSHTPRPQGLLVTLSGSSLPPVNLLVATAFFGFILFYFNNKYTIQHNAPRTFVFVILGLSGLGTLFLGDHWLTDLFAAYFAGATLSLIHCLMYQKKHLGTTSKDDGLVLMLSALCVLFAATTISSFLNYKVLKHNHIAYQKQYMLSQAQWWNQKQPVLPMYLLNRIGKPLSILNLQYEGDLDALAASLEHYGWVEHDESFSYKLLQRITSQSDQVKLPLLDILFQNHHPDLIMTYTAKDSKTVLELRFWEANYFIETLANPIWIGSVHHNKAATELSDPLAYVIPALTTYKTKRVEIPSESLKATIIHSSSYILLIK